MSAILTYVSGILLFLVKVFVFIYDFVTFPIYFIVQKPWMEWKKSNIVFGKKVNNADPYSPLTRAVESGYDYFKEIRTMDQVLRCTAEKFPFKPLFGVRDVLGEVQEKLPNGKVITKLNLGTYRWTTYKEVDRQVDRVGKGLLMLGIKSRKNVLILSETRMEWMIAAQACFRFNVPIVTLYTTLGDDGIIHGINESEATHIITSQAILPKLQKIARAIPLVKSIIYIEGNNSLTVEFPNSVQLVPFSKLQKLGDNCNSDLKTEPPEPDDIALIMYTSGSTGIPKGVMISHKNMIAATRGYTCFTDFLTTEDLYIAYLPLAHVLELFVECFFIYMGIPIGYSSPQTLTDKSMLVDKSCRGDSIVLKPTLMAAVPLVLDKIRKGILETASSKGLFMKSFFLYCVSYKQFWTKRGFQTPILNRLIFKNIQSLLGGKMRIIACGGAPLMPDTQEFIKACLNCQVVQGYGMTETACAVTFMTPDDNTVGNVGAPLLGSYIKLVDWEEGNYSVKDEPLPHGEIVVGGDVVTAGYYKNESQTIESYYEQEGMRWFRTGDIGELHPNGTFKIIDRKKDLVKLQHGEYVSLAKVEGVLKMCPLIENICVYGSSFQMKLVALVMPNRFQLGKIAHKLNKGHLSFHQWCSDEAIVSEVADGIKEYGITCKLQQVEIPELYKLCTEEWSPDNGLLTAAFKLRRVAIQQFYKKEIDELYFAQNRNGTTKVPMV